MSTRAQSLVPTTGVECDIGKARHDVAPDRLDQSHENLVSSRNADAGPLARGIAVTFWLDLGGVAVRSDRRFPANMPASPSGAIRIGHILSAIVIVLLFVDAVAQLASLPVLRAEVEASGFPFALSPVVGTITMTCVVLYAVPRTAVLGAILLTGFLGGAICLHLRLGEIGSPPQIVSLMLGVTAWGGLYLRDPRLRALLPLRA